MKNIFIINAGCTKDGQGGTLNASYVKLATETLEGLGHRVYTTKVDEDYDLEQERDKILDADVVILQTPGWWMSPPWQFKKYEDYVFPSLRLMSGDGRSRTSPERKYGSGGLCLNTSYMISCTWNAPREAFEDPSQFFEGVGIDGVFFGVHKAFQFMGMSRLPTFMANDVIKNPSHEQDFARFREHLTRHIG